MNVLIIGNGLAGTMAAKTLRELDSTVEIQVFSGEKYPYYPRPNLIEYLSGRLPYGRIFAFSEEWHVRQKIGLHFSEPVRRILPGSQEIELDGARREKYDALLVATGALSFIPPIKGADKRGVFALRTLDDALAILDYLKKHRNVAVIGGGLLGLEIARALKLQGAEVRVLEFFDRLLPLQLDADGATVLKDQIESLGIRVSLGVVTQEILGDGEVSGIGLKGGEKMSVDMVLIAAGVRSNLDLARDAGLALDRGLMVDDYLRTSQPQIFGAGDVVQHRGKFYGIIPASFDQARTAAYNILGQWKKYEGTIPSNTLKVAGLYVTSVGQTSPDSPEFTEIKKLKKEEGIYKKIVLKEGALVGAIWMGTKKGVNEISRAVALNLQVNQWVNNLLEDTFDFSVL